MAVVTWGTVRSLLIFFGPMLLPKAITWYRTARNAPKAARKPIVPLPRASLFAILLLSLSALTLLVLGAIPRLAPENLFTLTRSNPTTSTNLLAARLATLRPLTAQDEIILHTKFESKASRLLYYKYGPDALANCPFCTSQDPTTYLLYAIPSVAMPHLLNAVLLGLSTSHTLAGKAGAQWRSLAIYAAAAIAAIDFYALAQWDHVAGNDKARILAEVFFFYWVARTSRFVTLAALQLTLAGMLYLSSTNRMFVPDTTASERIEGITAALGMVNLRIRSANVLKNTVSRDAELRAIDVGYWAHEGVVMQEAMESMEVVESMRDAVENRRIDPQAMEQAAEAFAQRVMGDAGVDGFAG